MSRNLPPGHYWGITVQPRVVLDDNSTFIRSGGYVNPTYSYDGKNTGFEDQIRPGCLMGRMPDRTLVPLKRTQLTAEAVSTAVLTVCDSRFFKAGDTIDVGLETSLTIDSVDYSTDQITLTSAISASAEATVTGSGSLSGSATLVGINNDFVALKDTDGVWRTKQIGRLIEFGKFNSAMILGDLLAARNAGAAATNSNIFPFNLPATL